MNIKKENAGRKLRTGIFYEYTCLYFKQSKLLFLES